jgi:hypothetical protein
MIAAQQCARGRHGLYPNRAFDAQQGLCSPSSSARATLAAAIPAAGAAEIFDHDGLTKRATHMVTGRSG